MDQQLQKTLQDISTLLARLDERTSIIQKQLDGGNTRFKDIEDTVAELRTKQEGLMVRVGAGVTLISTIIVVIINKIINSL